ncbi:MAG: hypothetical protein IID09_03655 [Candidatus Hydrogenedentes bacterium]|nr:hypothetical protein [Candidatus Hydrogenedentota bacterium]
MTGSPGMRRISLFCLKFIGFLAVFLFLWWWKVQPAYAGLIGSIAGTILKITTSIPIDATQVEVDPAGVLSTKTALVFIVQQGRYPFDIASLIANIPPFWALVLATPGLAVKRLIKVLLIGTGILGAGHVLFLVLVFVFARQVQETPEVPTAIGLFLMTLPFMLWIVLAYWDKLVLLFEEPGESPAQEEKAPPSE